MEFTSKRDRDPREAEQAPFRHKQTSSKLGEPTTLFEPKPGHDMDQSPQPSSEFPTSLPEPAKSNQGLSDHSHHHCAFIAISTARHGASVSDATETEYHRLAISRAMSLKGGCRCPQIKKTQTGWASLSLSLYMWLQAIRLLGQEGAAQARAPLGVKAYRVEVTVDRAILHLPRMYTDGKSGFMVVRLVLEMIIVSCTQFCHSLMIEAATRFIVFHRSGRTLSWLSSVPAVNLSEGPTANVHLLTPLQPTRTKRRTSSITWGGAPRKVSGSKSCCKSHRRVRRIKSGWDKTAEKAFKRDMVGRRRDRKGREVQGREREGLECTDKAQARRETQLGCNKHARVVGLLPVFQIRPSLPHSTQNAQRSP